MSNETPVAKKWTSQAGPIQTKKVNEALSAIGQEGRTFTEKWGVTGVDEHDSNFYSPFSPPRAEANQALAALGEKFNWTVTRENHAQIITAAWEAVTELKKTRPVQDKRRTPEEEAERNAKSKKAEEEREAEARAKELKIKELVPEVRAKYPWAAFAREGISAHARTAQNVRTELGMMFPGIQFTVKSEYSRISISWELGPSEKEMKAKVSDKYVDSGWHNDGGDGYQTYDRSAEGAAITAVLGRVHHVSLSRTYPETVRTEVAHLLCKLQDKTFDGNWRYRGLCGDGDTFDVGDHVHQVLHRTSFTAGATVRGVEPASKPWDDFIAKAKAAYGEETWLLNRDQWSEEHKAEMAALEAEQSSPDHDPSAWCYLVLDVPDVSAAAQDAQPMTIAESGITIRRNLQKNGVEIRFANKPGRDVLDRLKAAGWHWAFHAKCWYTRFSVTDWQFAHKLAGIPAPELATEQGPDRFDMAVEDRMCEAAGA